MANQAPLLTLPPEWLAALVDAVADRVRAQIESRDRSPWLTRAAAAEYLSVPVSRLEKDRTVPCHRWEGRVLYNRDELDEWLLAA